jgi:hypothetical protein
MAMVRDRVEETASLDFKRQLPAPGRNDDLAKDMAAMANADGGVIVFGITDDGTGQATGLAPFNLDGAAERVQQIAHSIDVPVTLRESIVIDDADDPALGYLVVVIERTRRGPHIVKGLALGRAPRLNYPLSRRQVGELFAKSSGFMVEFGLQADKPGRLKVESLKLVRPGTTGSVDYYLQFENDGETEIFEADWTWGEDDDRAVIPMNPFPYVSLPPGAKPRVFVNLNSSRVNRTVRTWWQDSEGRSSEAIWPITWL